ncbi:hypothetical protein OESDEN_04486 [Oesophagostomum dentatum]|uniref:Uncharacterized protein n=1 Tax=Oesophagostomum dentatum TaxID=61180 RepID=A0A0B1TJJ5_OESDE|nr:hypothetical protein OESDEN_04486 [Oesophagostomum dentatum]
MMFIGFYTICDPLINGPWAQSLMDMFAQSSSFCKKGWWQNLLYINNFFDGQLEVCYGITWYLAVDTQLYFVAPVFLMALFISPIAGMDVLRLKVENIE